MSFSVAGCLSLHKLLNMKKKNVFINRLNLVISIKSVVSYAPSHSLLPVSAEGQGCCPGDGCTISITYFFLLPLMTYVFA